MTAALPEASMSVVIVPCRLHGRHHLDEKQAARVIVALYALCEDLVTDPNGAEFVTDTDRCAESMLEMALCQEGYAEWVDAEFEGIGINRHLECEHDVSRRLVKPEAGAR